MMLYYGMNHHLLLLIFIFRLLVVLFFSGANNNANAQPYFERPNDFSCSPDKYDYEWERLNYYEILDLPRSSSAGHHHENHLDSKAIRKSYRRQAQLWHPDKIKANATLTIDEINNRFAKIAQAYEILNDPSKRQAYDRFLENCDYINIMQQGEQQHQHGNHQHYHHHQQDSNNNNYHGYPYENPYSSDPNDNPHYNREQQRHYYGGGRYGRQDYDHHDYDRYDRFQQQQQQQQQKQRRRHHHPSSVKKEQEMLVDPMTGAPILRETTFEEYLEENYFRVLVMDFLVEDMDAWGNSYYHPLYPEPMVMNEGKLHQRQQKQLFSDTLLQGDVLRRGQILLSANERFRARVHDCHLVVEVAIEDDDGDDDVYNVVWASDNYSPLSSSYYGLGHREAECFLALEGGRLMVAGGSPEFHTGDILWYSTVKDITDSSYGDDRYDFGFFQQHGHNSYYIARLEDDGKLVVYRMDNLPPFFSKDVGGSREETCVFATGPLGCFRVVSKVLHACRVARDHIERLLDTVTADPTRNEGSGTTHGDDKAYSYWDDDYDGDDNDLSSAILRKAKHVFEGLNRARKQAEVKMEEKTLKFVHDVHLRWHQNCPECFHLVSKVERAIRAARDHIERLLNLTSDPTRNEGTSKTFGDNKAYGWDDYDGDDDALSSIILRKAKRALKGLNRGLKRAGCFRVVSKVKHAIRSARDHVERLLDLTAGPTSYEGTTKTRGGNKTYRRANYDGDDDDNDLSSTILCEAKHALKVLNRARKLAEVKMEEQTLKFVHDVHMRWQQQRSRNHRDR